MRRLPPSLDLGKLDCHRLTSPAFHHAEPSPKECEGMNIDCCVRLSQYWPRAALFQVPSFTHSGVLNRFY